MLNRSFFQDKKRIFARYIKLILSCLFISCFTNITAFAMSQEELNGEKPPSKSTAASSQVHPSLQIKSICVYCSASSEIEKTHLIMANNFGKILAQNNIRLVYGGGHIGMMGQLADGCLEEGGYVHGVIPEHLQSRELGHKGYVTSKRVEIES